MNDSFISDSDDDEILMTPLHKEIFDQLLAEGYSKEPEQSVGFIDQPISIPERQTLYIVCDYYERTIPNGEFPEIILRVWPGKGHPERFVHLRDEWIKTRISIGDTCFVITTWQCGTDPEYYYIDQPFTILDQHSNFLIVLPNILIAGTSMASAYRCIRSSYINNLLPAGGEQKMVFFRGTICHEILQKVFFGLKEADIEYTLDNLLQESIRDLFLMKSSIPDAKAEIMPYLDTIKKIAHELEFGQKKKIELQPEPKRVWQSLESLPPFNLKVVKEEESIWSFQWGVKGMVDATLEANKKMVPFELKSGTSDRGVPRNENILQLSSYMFMMKERYKSTSSNVGLLFYMKDQTAFSIAPDHNALLNVVTLRNQVAHAIAHGAVPQTLQASRMCQWCNGVEICAFLDDGTSPIHSWLQSHVALQPTKRQREFFEYWEQTLVDEMAVTLTMQTALWTVPVKDRVQSGRALQHLRTSNGMSPLVEFTCADADGLAHAQLVQNNMVMVTRSGLPPIIGRGVVTAVEPDRITVEMLENQMHEQEEDIALDAWESNTTVDTCRRNLMTLMSSENLYPNRLRELIVEGAPPQFDPLPATIPVPDADLNDDQRQAIRIGLAAKDYMLLLGMPGTGKTFTLARLIESFARNGQSVLIASYTHTAVDNLCMKLMDLNVNFLRVGSESSIHPGVRAHSLDVISKEAESIEGLRMALSGVNIYAATCLGFHDPFVLSRSFDVCVIDEASQISMTAVLGPLTRARKFILVGDHYQLPPIRKYHVGDSDPPASLFRSLCESHPHALVTLRTQYRMNYEIMSLCNALVYGHRMRCGSAASAQNRIFFTNFSELFEFHPMHQQWLTPVISPEPTILFLDTDQALLREHGGMGSKQNIGEAVVVSITAIAMMLCGLPPESVGIISPYRAQVLLIRKVILAELSAVMRQYPHIGKDPAELAKEFEVHTVDKFQGRDKDCIIVSAVKSNERNRPGSHITDWQRLNVAITRAKTKLIFVGSKTTLINSPFFEGFFKMLDERSIVKLPQSVNEGIAKPFISISSIETIADIETQDY